MKHLFLTVIAITFIAVGCNKSKQVELQPVESSDATTINDPIVSTVKDPPNWHRTRMKRHGWCSGWRGNCILIDKDIIVYASKQIIDDAASTGSSQGVGEAFNREELIDFNLMNLDEEYSAKLKSGDYYLLNYLDDGGSVCYISGTEYPVTFENAEFAFQFMYGQ